MISLINTERINNSKLPMAPDIRLENAVQLHVDDMITNSFFGHTGSDGSSFGERILAQVYSVPSGEVISTGSSNPMVILDLWMSSPSHRDVIINETHNHLGIGFSKSQGLWVIDFGKTTDSLTSSPNCCEIETLGNWTLIWDSGYENVQFDNISWNSYEPVDISISIEVKNVLRITIFIKFLRLLYVFKKTFYTYTTRTNILFLI